MAVVVLIATIVLDRLQGHSNMENAQQVEEIEPISSN